MSPTNLHNLKPPTAEDMQDASGIAKLAVEDWPWYVQACERRFFVVSELLSAHFGGEVRGRSVLDWGSSIGGVAMLINDGLRVKVTAADVDRPAIAWLRRRRKRMTTAVLEPAKPLPFEDDSFDAIYGISVLTHIPPDLQEFYLSELYRVIKPGGIVLLTVKGYDSIARARSASLPRHLHPQDKNELDWSGVFYSSYPENMLAKMKFARDHAGYGITYHADAYIEQVFSRWFNVDRSATAKIGKQEVLSLTPLAEVGPEKPYVRPMDARKPGFLRRLERKLRV